MQNYLIWIWGSKSHVVNHTYKIHKHTGRSENISPLVAYWLCWHSALCQPEIWSRARAGFAFSIDLWSLGTTFLSLSYISITGQFTTETQFEFLLHLVTLNWTERPVIIKGPAFYWQFHGSRPEPLSAWISYSLEIEAASHAVLWPFLWGFSLPLSAVWKV